MTSLKKLLICFLVVIGTGVQAAASVSTETINATQARHLLVRTGFAPEQAEVDLLHGQIARQAVTDLIVRAQSAQVIHPAPAFVTMPPPIPYGSLKTTEEKQAMRQLQQREGLELKTWWMREMIESSAPLQERMTLFWHNHFASSQQKVISSQAMWRQHQIFRTHALGNFRTLLHSVAKDPAMLVYLDGANNRREAPNENFAREVMELFTLGESTKGGYTVSRMLRKLHALLPAGALSEVISASNSARLCMMPAARRCSAVPAISMVTQRLTSCLSNPLRPDF